MINSQLANALHTNEIIRALLVMDRRIFLTDVERSKAATRMTQDSNLLEFNFYPILGVMLVEGFGDEIKRLIDFSWISSASLVTE